MFLALALAAAACSSGGGGQRGDGGPDADAGLGTDAGLDAADNGDPGAGDPGGGTDQDLPPDPCLGVICDQPPDNACGPGEWELWVYEAIGDCDHDTGECNYDPRGIKCSGPCVDGACADVDLCAEPFCHNPPSPICGADGFSITRFETGGTCDPATGRCIYASTEDTCESGCRFGRCLPPAGADAALEVAPGTDLCSFFWGGDLFEVHREQGRLRLQPGVHPLVLGAGEQEADLFASLRLGPDGRTAQPAGPARLFPSYDGTSDEGAHRVDIEQTYTVGDRHYLITGRAIFEVLNGRLVEPVMKLATDTRSRYDRFVIEGQYLPAGRFPMYSGCAVSWLAAGLRFTLDNGDVVSLEYGYAGLGCREQGGCAGEPFPGRIMWAEATLGGTGRRVEDYFDLAFNTQHHEDGKAFLLVFDEPVDRVHALHIPPGESQEFDRVNFLDAAFDVLQTVPIAEVQSID